MATYDRIGHGYTEVRQPDPRIAARVEAALGDAKTVLNVGAGAGSYEPADREVTAVEPSEVMIAQRPPGSAPVVQASAEELPFEDDSFDAAMAIITVQHWADPRAGLIEMARVARQRVVVLTFDAAPLAEIWLARDYFPRVFEFHDDSMPTLQEYAAILPNTVIEEVPVPRRCTDGFFCALWDRPEMHLDPKVRQGSSVWHALPPDQFEDGLTALRADLESGEWDARHGYLREETPELDVGLRLMIVDVS